MALVTVQGSMVADANAVAAFQRVDAYYGGRLVITAPYGANRTRAQQQKLRNDYLAGRGSYAAPPGDSNHEHGLAFDINNWAQFSDLQTVMAHYGFRRDPVEKWHYNFTGAASPAGDFIAPAAVNSTPIPSTPEIGAIQTMYLTDDTNQTVWLVTDNGAVALRDPAHIGYFTRLGVTRKDRFLRAEVDIMQNYIREAQGGRAADAATASVNATNAALAKIREDLGYLHTDSPDSLKAIHTDVKAGGVNPAPIVAAVTSAVQTAIAATGVKVDAAVIAKAVEAQLADEFAAVPKAVLNEEANRLAN
jgi:hypothetical protein